MSTRDSWQPVWRSAPDVVTIDLHDGACDTRREAGDGSLITLDFADTASISAAPTRTIIATGGHGAAVEQLARFTDSDGPALRIVDRRESLAAGATGGFGGACIAIACERDVSVDFADGERFLRGSTLPGLARAADAQTWATSVDRAIYATAEASGTDGPLLVITGADAKAYQRYGALPVQFVAELVHRGMVELGCVRNEDPWTSRSSP